jgi:choline-sulfatase
LTDLFALATGAAGSVETRDGIDVLGLLDGQVKPRDCYVGMYEVPGSSLFKCMVRWREWKYIFMANGGREQLFNLAEDPHELRNCISAPNSGEFGYEAVAEELRACAVYSLSVPNADRALEHGRLKAFPFRPRPLQRVYQMDGSRGVRGFPEHPSKVLESQEEH